MNLKRLQIRTGLLSLTLLASTVSFADVVTGTLIVDGNATVQGNTITFTDVAVFANGTNDASLTPGTSVTIGTLTGSAATIGQPINIPSWLTVADLSLDLKMVFQGTDPAAPLGTPPCGTSGGAVGDQCTPILPGAPPYKSPFNLSDNAANTFTAGFITDGTSTRVGSPAPNMGEFVSGSFTSTDPGTYQTQLGIIAGGGAVNLPFQAQFTLTATPEPGFLPLFGGSALLLAFAGFYRKLRHQQQ